MIKPFTKKELFKNIAPCLNRLTPHIITEINDPNILYLFHKLLPSLKPYVILEKIETPKGLFSFIKEHQHELIVLKDDIFSKRKNYIDIVQGAVCSIPDSSALWSVCYLNEKNFIFRGKLILCTTKTKEEIVNDNRFSFFARDCEFI
jgi:hypothetical protein